MTVFPCGIDWQAVATFSAGFLAVAAAIYVGKKQIEIQHRQTDIQAQSLRSDLFDRRYRIYDRTKNFVHEVMRCEENPDQEIQNEFLMAVREAKFLFGVEVVSGIDEIWERACKLRALSRTIQHSIQTEGNFGPGNTDERLTAGLWFSDRLQTLPHLFGEMTLSGRLERLTPYPSGEGQ